MIHASDLEEGDLIDINYHIYSGRRKVKRIYQRYQMDYVDLEDDMGRVDDFSIIFLNNYGSKHTKASKSFTITNDTGSPIVVRTECYLHTWKDDIWFTSKVFTYCSTCGKSKEETETKPTREFF